MLVVQIGRKIISPQKYKNTRSNYSNIFIVLGAFFFFFYLGFLSRPFTNHRTAGEGGGHFFNSSLPLPPVSQTLRHQAGNYCRELTSAQRQQPDSSQEPLVSEWKSLTTELQALLGALKSLLCFPLDIEVNEILNCYANYLLRMSKQSPINRTI